MTHTMVIPNWLPPSCNAVARVKVKEGIRVARECHDFIAAYARKQNIPRARTARRVRVTIIFPPNRKRPDPLNLSKVLMDSLVRCRLLIDDDHESSRWEPPLYLIGERLTTIIELEDIPVQRVMTVQEYELTAPGDRPA